MHDPANRLAHSKASSRGGQANTQGAGVLLDPIALDSAQALLELLADTINRIRVTRGDGSMDVRTANGIGQLARVLVEARKNFELEERVAELEKVAQIGKGGRPTLLANAGSEKSASVPVSMRD